ncbi:hypothetical protein [Streptomyces sp. NPDC127190]|uniref:hypothetical protein n=1 Tax=unclassified Streptomyces TaxID=2593676 RepID=UPI003640E502
MLHRSGGRPAHSPDPRRIRLLALVGVSLAAVVLPLAVASAGQVGDAGPSAVRTSPRPAPSGAGGRQAGPEGDAKRSSAGARAPRLLGLGLATAARCGPELSSPEGVEAQTCVLTQGSDTWARTYYRNATGAALDSVLSLMGPGGRSIETRCAMGADDEPATCETPREPSRGAPDAYTAVTEFAEPGADGELLLRSGSNAAVGDGNTEGPGGS